MDLWIVSQGVWSLDENADSHDRGLSQGKRAGGHGWEYIHTS